MKQLREITLIAEKEDYVTVSLPLLIRLMEWARESAKSDIDLHKVAERISKFNGAIDMEKYNELIKNL